MTLMLKPWAPGVYVTEEAGPRPIVGVGTAIAAFIGFAELGPDETGVGKAHAGFNRPTLVSNWTEFTTKFGKVIPGASLAQSVNAYFQNGGGLCYIVRIGEKVAEQGVLPAIEAKSPQGNLPGSNLKAIASDPATPPDAFRVRIEEVPGEGEGAPSSLRLVVVDAGGEVVEQHAGITTGRRSNVMTKVNGESKLIRLELATPGSALELKAGEVALTAPPGGGTPSSLKPEDFLGDVSHDGVIASLELVDEITMVCMPDLVTAHAAGAITRATVQAVQGEIVTHCARMEDRMAILDPPAGEKNPKDFGDWVEEQSGIHSPFATIYWPWVGVPSPDGKGTSYLPPSGFIAGIWSRSDATRGVHKAPANEIVRGAISLEAPITREVQGLLNERGINCIRAFPGRGIRVWGARTLDGKDSPWRYLNVRRLFNYLEESIIEGTDWVVFEPNDRALWAKLRRAVSAFLVLEWRGGGLFGANPDEAFFVKCDDETNPAEAIEQGEVTCIIGVAPVKPAEFVIFKLSQLQGGVSLIAE
jgi:phage tail sheath protein FI